MKKTKLIFGAHPNARLRVAEKIGKSVLRAEWRTKEARRLRKCPSCKNRLTKEGPHRATLDHIIPLVNGGADEPDNWQVLCWTCNQAKGATMPEVDHG